MYLQRAPSRENHRSSGRSRRYVAHHTLTIVRERAVSSVSESPGTIWRGLRRRGQFRSGVFHLRDNHLCMVLVSVGGYRGDFVAAIIVQGAVAVATFHIQCGSDYHQSSDGT
jgi:hypothetical protein